MRKDCWWQENLAIVTGAQNLGLNEKTQEMKTKFTETEIVTST